MPCRQVSQDARAGSAAKRCARALSPIAVACGSGSKTSPPPIADRCQVSNGGCDRNAICSFAANQVSCTCKDGFLGDGLRCASGDVVVDAATALAPIKRSELGLNMNPFVDLSDARLVPALRQLNASILRFPSGFADDYHWQTNTDCVYTPHPASTFDVFMKNVAGPLGADVVIGVNYGSNASCNGPGDPAEAAAWVDAANNHNKYGIHWWVVGNEDFCKGCGYDLHAKKHDPTTYAREVTQGYYPAMKAKDPSIAVGVNIAGHYDPSFDAIVLAQATYDFVEFHYYPQDPGNENDAQLLRDRPAEFGALIAKIRDEMRAAGKPQVPLMLGEYNSVNLFPGQQSVSIVNALFLAMATAETLKAGVEIAAVFDGFDVICTSGYPVPGLYGWQHFGSYSMLSPGPLIAGGGTPSGALDGCAPTARNESPEYGAPYPGGHALSLAYDFARSGEKILGTFAAPSVAAVRGYGASLGQGFKVLLVNIDGANAVTAALNVLGAEQGPYTASLRRYGKQEYDLSKTGTWSGPTAVAMGAVMLPVAVTLPPWSVTLVTLMAR